jgi:outer membrane protein assembly factor BamB
LALKAGAKVLWKADIGYGYSNVVIQAGRLYAMGAVPRKGVVFSCLDAATGAVLWQQSFDQGGLYDNPDPHATPVIDGERVYGITLKGVLYCLQSGDGQVLWTRNLAIDFKREGWSYGWVASPVVAGNLLLVSNDERGIALNKTNGQTAWETTRDPGALGKGAHYGAVATPVVANLKGTDCVLFLNRWTLTVADLATGKAMRSYVHNEQDYHLIQDPIVSGDRVFLEQSFRCDMLKCSETALTNIWSGTQIRNSMFNPVLVDGNLYGSHWDPEQDGGAVNYDWNTTRKIRMPLRCLDWNTGEVVWEHDLTGGVSVTAVDGKLILLDLNGMLRIAKASPAGYEELAVADVLQGEKYGVRIFPTPPAFCDGRIYCRNFNNALICIDVSR